MATGRGEVVAEKAYRLAEDRFLANDIAGALRAAREAQRLFRALPGLANAVTAYEVHAAAATSRASGRNWYAILAVGDRSATTSSRHATYESLKKQYRRLCLVLHPDKNRCAAADGAFKLLRQAWDELSLRHRPGAAAAPPVSRPPPPKPWGFPCPGQCARCGTKFTATVYVGTWHLRCDACHTYTMVYVKSADLATTGISFCLN
ncbi:hypothetical protein E2562_014037 [Oryza meyeriana var. granulata]|uniref:J domain-containing protein n=1 Tax=Oryza meyeriana var. granulata TaxID=110450 RepID=A0A6G1DIZ7_9ORYZ|nr:hypothetical protein E2562_014037 [Oryza meyeriana var. granulata]